VEKYENDILYLEGKTEQLELLGIKKNIKKGEEKVNKKTDEERTNFLPSGMDNDQGKSLEQFFLERGIREPNIERWVNQIDDFLKGKYSLQIRTLTGSQSKSA